MSRIFDDNVANFLDVSDDLGITNVPVTIGCWAKLVGNSTNCGVFEFVNDTVEEYNMRPFMTNNQLTYRGAISQTDGGRTVVSSVSVVLGEWAFVAVQMTDRGPPSTRVNVFVNDTLNTDGQTRNYGTNNAPAFLVGKFLTTGSYAFNGNIAHVAVWSSELSSGDLTLLGSGTNPTEVDAANLQHYWPMIDGTGGGETDIINSLVLTENGSVGSTAADNPPVDPPPGPGPGPTIPPLAMHHQRQQR